MCVPLACGQRHKTVIHAGSGWPTRVGSAVLALAAAALAVVWTREVVAYTDPSINTRAVPETGVLVSQAIVGSVGVALAAASAVFGAGYVVQHRRRWLRRQLWVGLGALAVAPCWVFFAIAVTAS